ncbi:Mitochondrial escape protein 2 [Fulvia fulva]|uniref:Mitochondrial escape protein 2 n=1 Tax=Passalora fulva TaxID=5499 RepID=A0A9Q8LAZ9_PASFU|nr:Mitochondrial escape protein 2 [Fulvia fulva]KAK4630902.1 Mitochondrial escape protein 2 [Fulvia fulva]KAK4632536.1 Mitochondrial escape protein 2 [Fulvia fulva]UJO14050.1 Mitochondrial escape protein 2 [Fulvia fulva]WPV10707.1 Mitochondrial escape protein 2 [Fulvia fulva]WPV26336.1 Mitochondrial escape protein 2 [Fulvia fulva]
MLLSSKPAGALLPLRRPSHPLPTSLPSKRYLAGDTGDNKSGHITTTSQEGIIFFNSILPPNLQWLFRLTSTLGRKSPKLADASSKGISGVVNPGKVFSKATKEAQLSNVEVVEVLPRFSEGGAFLKFNHDGSADTKTIADAVRQYLKQNKARPWWNPFTHVRASLVLGKPWVEDLSRRASQRVKVEFLPTEPGAEAAELTQEQLYSFFRQFGKLSDIMAQPSDSKVVPRFAYLDFAHHQKAIMAKNCMHGYTVSDAEGGGKSGTVLRLTYEKKQRWKWFSDWMVNHPRIVIPLLAALVAGLSVVIFDPIRTLSIKAHITRAFHIEDNFVFRWFRQQGEDLINRVKSFGRDEEVVDGGMQVVWEDRQDEIQQIQSWLMESADTFIVVQGPRGSGKRELVIEHALQHKREAHRVLVVDCKPVQEARGDAATIASAANQVGYSPVFSWINNISGLMDLAAQGMTGTKAGFSETLENQLVKIFAKTSAALKSIALDGRKKDHKDAKPGDDEFLEQHPERRPVVVIDNFLHKSSEEGATLVYDKLAEWAAQLTSSNIAHVIFLTTDVSFSKSLSKALPDRVFRQISLGDCSPEVAKRYVIQHLDFDAKPVKVTNKDGEEEVKILPPSQKREDLQELDDVIGYLGGRLTDLEFFARRIKAGETPTKAVREIVDQSASEILKMYLLLGSDSREWTSAQAWTLVRDLAKHEALRYNEVLMETAFGSGGDKAIQALEQAELITVQSANGRPYSIKPGKPVYQPAFQRLVSDNVLRAKLELSVLGDAIAAENKSIDKYEQELHLLAKLPKQPVELYDRIQWLLGKIKTSQSKVEVFEKESGDLKKILQTEF